MDPAVEAMNMAEKGPQKNEEIMLKTVLEVFVKMVVCRRTMTQQMRAGHLVPLTISETMEEEKPMTFPVHKSETIRSASLPSNVHLQLSQEPHHDRNIPVSMHPSHLHQTVDGETITSDFETAVCSLPRNVTSSCSERLLKSAAPNKDSQEANLQSAEVESTQMLSNVGSDVVSQGSSLCGATVTRTDGAITMADEEMKPERSERVKYAKECKGEGTFCAHISIPVEPVSVDANEDHYIDVEKDICTDKTPAHSDEVIYDKVKCIDCPHSVVSAFTPLSRKEVVGAYSGKERSTEVKLDMKDKIIQPISSQPSRDEDICHVFGCPLCKGWSSVGKCSQNVMKSKLSCPSCSRDLTVYLTGKRNVVETSKHSTYEEIHDTTAEISAEKTKHDSMDIMIDSSDEDNHSDEDVDRNEGVNDTHIDDGSCKIDTSILAKSGGHLQGNSKMMVKLWNTAKRGKGKQRALHSIKMEGKLKQQHQQQKFERKKITDFKCEICSKCFSNSANLKKHIINVHERKRSHCCEMCGKQFCYRSDLAEHMSVHTDERKHLCQVCGECFKTSRSLKLHVKRVHQMANVFPFQCKECGDYLKSKVSLQYHYKSFHSGPRARPYTKKRKVIS